MKKWIFLVIFYCNICQISSALTKTAYDSHSNKTLSLEKPADWLELKIQLRLRAEMDEARKLNQNAIGHDRIAGRARLRVGAKFKLNDDTDFNLRIASEPRYYVRPKSMNKQLIKHELLFDRMNLAFRNVFDMPLTAVIGRQDIQLGSKWLIADGTPLDGGRTGFFDAVRLTYEFEESDLTADLIWIENHADSAKILKPFNDRDLDFAEQDERGAILYLSKKTGQDSGMDGYFIFKQYNERVSAAGYKGEVYTFGGMKYGRLKDDWQNWQYCAESAIQFGHKNGKAFIAIASNSQLIYNFNDDKERKIYLGYEYLSGHDDKDKCFDRLWGRVDTWSVLYQGNIDAIDGRSYDNSNLHRLYADYETNLSEKTKLRAGYNLLFADQNTSAGGTNGISRSGHFRGQLLRAQMVFKASENIEHKLEGELFFPGDYYANDRNDVAVFARYSVVFNF